MFAAAISRTAPGTAAVTLRRCVICARPGTGARASGANGLEMSMTETKGKGSHAARRANAAAAKEGKANPRTSSGAQSILGKKGARSKS